MHEDPWERRGDEPDRDGPGPVSPNRPVWPSFGVGSAPLSLHSKDLQPYVPGGTAIRERESHSHREAIHTLERERREISGGGSPISEEAPTSGEEGRHRQKRHHDQRCHVWHLDGVSLFVHGL
jgi:hypothetical protein